MNSSTTVLLLEGRQASRPCLHPFLRYFQSLLIFSKPFLSCQVIRVFYTRYQIPLYSWQTEAILRFWKFWKFYNFHYLCARSNILESCVFIVVGQFDKVFRYINRVLWRSFLQNLLAIFGKKCHHGHLKWSLIHLCYFSPRKKRRKQAARLS